MLDSDRKGLLAVSILLFISLAVILITDFLMRVVDYEGTNSDGTSFDCHCEGDVQ